MRLSKTISFRLMMAALAVGSVSIATTVFYAEFLADTRLSRFSAQVTGATALGGFLAFLALVVYTRETYHLRLAAEHQVEATSKAVLVLRVASAATPSEIHRRIDPISLTNVGTGPAFSILVDSLKGGDVEVEMRLSPSLVVKAGEQVSLTFCILQGGTTNGMSRSMALLVDLFTRQSWPQSQNVGVTFESISGMRYRTQHAVTNQWSGRQVETSYQGIQKL